MSQLLAQSVTIDGHKRIDFDKRLVRKAMRSIGTRVRKLARQKVSGKASQRAGQYPGKRTGELRRSIKSKVSRPGFLVVVRPEKTERMKDFYPAFLWYGVTGNARRKDRRSQPKNGVWRIAPRDNYMIDALDETRSANQSDLQAALLGALKPR